MAIEKFWRRHLQGVEPATLTTRDVFVKKLTLLLCATSFLAFATFASAVGKASAAASDELRNLLQQAQSIKGDFEQRLFDRDQHLLQTTQGTFTLQRPGNFFWKTSPPYEQVVVGNSEKLWVYDPDLEQVTVHNQDRRQQTSPAHLLSGELDGLEEHYDVTREVKDGITRFTLMTKDDNGMFARLQLDYRNGVLAGLHFEDNMGQVTELSFSNVEMNPTVNPAIFTFQVPPGVDVIVDE